MKKEIILWQLIVVVLGMFLILTTREYLLDRNEIEAEKFRANCIVEMEKAFPKQDRFSACSDIKTYKLKFNR